MTKREELKKQLNAEKEQVQKIREEVEERNQRVSSLAELQVELQHKLHVSILAMSEGETELEKVMAARTEVLMEIEELRKQRDVLQRGIKFFKEENVAEISGEVREKGCSLREFTKEEIILATNNFSDQLRMKCGGVWSNVYRGYFNHSTSAIKMLDFIPDLSQQDFQSKVNKQTRKFDL